MPCSYWRLQRGTTWIEPMLEASISTSESRVFGTFAMLVGRRQLCGGHWGSAQLVYISCKLRTICIGTLLIHSRWNSAVFDSIPIYPYTTAIVTSDFETNNATWNRSLNPGQTDLPHLQEIGHTFERLNKTECIRRYLRPFSSGKDLIVVTNLMTNELSNNDSTSLITAFQSPGKGADWDTESLWLCADNVTWPKTCTYDDAPIMAENWIIGRQDVEPNRNVTSWSAPVQYCLSGGTNIKNMDCGFHWSISIMVLVSALNVVNIVAIWFVAKWCREPSLVRCFLHYSLCLQ